MRVLVAGGYFDRSAECFVDRLDPTTGAVERLVSFVPPEPHRVETKGFTGASFLPDGSLAVCSFDSVWRFAAPGEETPGHLHQPDFNDLHAVHVDPEAGHLHVCNSGLDAVETFDLHGEFLGRAAMTPAWFEAARLGGAGVSRDDFPRVLKAGWGAVSRPRMMTPDGSYYDGPAAAVPFHRRKVRDYAHPNHVVRVGPNLLVTLLARSEVFCAWTLRTMGRIPAPPHDGIWVDDQLWLTSVDGRAWRLVPGGSGAPELVLDTAATGHFGWCRGLLVGPTMLVVGLTEIRTEPRYAWRRVPFERTETSVLWFDRQTLKLVGRVDLTDRARHSKIFAILAPRGAWA